MPEYEFESKDGERVSVFLPISQAPKMGSRIKRDGKTFVRIPSLLARPRVAEDVHVVNYQLPAWSPLASAYDKDGSLTGVPGRCLTTSMRDVDNICAKSEGKYKNGYRKFDSLRPVSAGRAGSVDGVGQGRAARAERPVKGRGRVPVGGRNAK